MRPKILTRFFQQTGLLGFFFVMSCSGDIKIKTFFKPNPNSVACSSDCPIIESVSPRAAAPGTKITVRGKNLGGKRSFLVGEKALTPLDRSASELSFIMPEGKNGYMTIGITGGGTPASQPVYRLADGSYPIITLDAGLVCSDIVFYNAEGEITTGTKDCEVLSAADKVKLKPENIKAGVSIGTVIGTLESGVPSQSCSTAGETDCTTTSAFWTAMTSDIAGKILAGESIVGVSGTLTLPPASAVRVSAGAYGPDGNAVTPLLADCGSNGQADCVANSTYQAADLSNLTAANIKAGVSIAGQAGAYPSATYPLTGADATNDLAGFGPAVATGTYEFFSSVGARYTGTLADGGTITPGTSNQTVSAANTFYRQLIVAGDSDLAAVNIKDAITVFGVTGVLTGAPSNCNADGQDNCLIDGTNYKAAAVTGAADKILAGQTLAGIAGTITLPAVGKVLTATSYGVGGNGSTGTLTLPAAANVLNGSGAYGEPGAQLTPTYSPDFPSLANVRTTDTVDGASGTLADCGSDGSVGCVVIGPTYAALLKTGAQDKILSGNTIGSVTGNVTLPALTKVLTATSYGVAGNGSTGTLTLPTAANVLTGSGAYGEPGSQLTPAYSPDFPDAANVLSSDTVNSASGTLTLPAAGKVFLSTSYGVAGNGSTGTLTLPTAANVLTGSGAYGEPGSQLTPAYSPDFPAVSNVLSSDTVNSASGTLTLPPVSQVLLSTSYGVAGTGSTGTLTLPAVGRVLTATAYGVAGTGSTGTLTLPAAGNVLSSNGNFGDASALTTPTLSLPAAGKVLTGTSYGAAGTGSTGALTLPSAGNVLTGTGTYGDTAALMTPTLTLPAVGKVLSATTYGVAGTGSTGTLTLPAAGAVRSSAGAYGDTGSTVTGTISDCTANGSGCYLPSYVATTQPLRAISYDAIDAGKASIRSTLTVGGVTGTLANCADGDIGCYILGPNFKAAAVSGSSGDKILFGQTMAGYSGTVTLPLASKVLTGHSYGVGGNGLTGSLTVPAAGNVLTGSGTYGDPLALITPTLTLPDSSKVLTGTSFGVSGSTSSGALTLPSASNVLAGSGSYGDSLSQISPTYVCPSYVRPAPPTITSITFNQSPDRVSVNWGAISGAAGYLVIMKRNAAVTWTPTDGQSYSTGVQGSDTIVYTGSGTSVTYNTDVAAGNTYHFAVYSYIANNIYSYLPSASSQTSCIGLSGSWVVVPPDSTYGTTGFCVMKYEAKNVSGTATSQASSNSWLNLGTPAAQAECAKLGANVQLITNNQWMSLASNIASTAANWSGGSVGSGSVNIGHSDNSPSTGCAASSDDSFSYVQSNCTPKNTGTPAQKRTHILSTGAVIWDVAGNWKDRTSYEIANNNAKPYVTADGAPVNAERELSAIDNGFTVMTLRELRPINAEKSFWSDSWNSTQGMGSYVAGDIGSGGGLLRGGDFYYQLTSGIFDANLWLAASFGISDTTFRCTAMASP